MKAYILKYALKHGVMVVYDAIELGDGRMIREGRQFPIYRDWQWAKTEEAAKVKFEIIKQHVLNKTLHKLDLIEASEYRYENEDHREGV